MSAQKDNFDDEDYDEDVGMLESEQVDDLFD